jgi:hypothetical protein
MSQAPGFPVRGGVRATHRVSYLCCGVFLYFVCLRPVFYVPNAASVSRLSIPDCTFGFL